MNNVYKIEDGIGKLNDGRMNPKHKSAQVIMPLLLGFLLRIGSMNDLKFRLCKDELLMFSPGELCFQR